VSLVGVALVWACKVRLFIVKVVMSMGSFGGFYKGEKKKPKKNKQKPSSVISNRPTLVLPEVITKKGKTQSA
jgi:hypothetical protein